MKAVFTNQVIYVIIMVTTSVLLSGCPLFQSGNGMIVHGSIQNLDNATGTYGAVAQASLCFFSAVRVPDECSHDTPEGINLLKENLGDGDKLKIAGFEEGRYYCVYRWTGYGVSKSGSGYLTLVSGQTLNVRPTPSL